MPGAFLKSLEAEKYYSGHFWDAIELADSGVPKVVPGRVLGWEARIRNQISETPINLQDNAEIKWNGFAFETRLRIFIPSSG
ncbi:hypothetical protein TNCV_568311 [Trichonephila clavipes]|nr:hypothetical protein TNCV_568311 [Trichonephila clavipes]